MIITITEVSQEFTKSGAEYLKIKGTTPDGKETTKSIFNNLKDAWGLLVEGATLEFTLEHKGQFWNVVEIKPVGTQGLKPDTGQAKMEIAPQAIGMMTKEIGDMIRAGKLSDIFDARDVPELITWYRRQVIFITQIGEIKDEKTESVPETKKVTPQGDILDAEAVIGDLKQYKIPQAKAVEILKQLKVPLKTSLFITIRGLPPEELAEFYKQVKEAMK